MRVEFIGSLSAISKFFVMEIVDDDFEIDKSRYEESNLSVFFTSRCFDMEDGPRIGVGVTLKSTLLGLSWDDSYRLSFKCPPSETILGFSRKDLFGETLGFIIILIFDPLEQRWPTRSP
jgi:hypothetical protein